jgi:HSP20 family molecular chaperone IbpA
MANLMTDSNRFTRNYKPFEKFDDMFADVFSDWVRPLQSTNKVTARYLDSKNRIEYELEVPGFEPSELEVKDCGSTILVTGKRKGKDLRVEFRVNEGYDSSRAEATLKNGLLTIQVPCSDRLRPNIIAVKPG